jgi:hypothetical protein
MVDASDIETFEGHGVVCLRRVFSDDWIARVRSGIDKDLADLGPLHTIQQPTGSSPTSAWRSGSTSFASSSSPLQRARSSPN